MIDEALLLRAMKSCTRERAELWAEPLDYAMTVFDIDTEGRASDFIAQLGHESGGLRWDREIWGPQQVPAQRTYERDPLQPWGPGLQRGDRNYKAWTLGNSEPGDGRRFSGHGPIQVTGRANHRQARDDLRAILGEDAVPDFERDPLMLTLPKWGSLAAGNFWRRRGLNALADAGTRDAFEAQTRAINGGLNGWDDRWARRKVARRAFGLPEE